jgi:alpha-1,6-mannosyltransferase
MEHPPSSTAGTDAAPSSDAPSTRDRLTVLGALRMLLRPPVVHVRTVVLCGFLGSLLVAATAPMRAEAAPTWRLTVPGVPHPGGPAFSAVTFVGGVLLLSLAWVRLGALTLDPAHAGRRMRIVVAACALWAVPVSLGPPLLSNDVYSYAAQGELAARGVDPTSFGPIALGGGRFLRAADSVWWSNPSPYGPVWNRLGQKVVTVTGHDPALSVWGFRAIAVLSVLACAVFVVDLARRNGHRPSTALALSIANPVVLLHLVGGSHNDALMLALLLGALCLHRRRLWTAAVVVMTIAAAVKLPAAAGLVYLGWHSPLVRDGRLQRMTAAAVTSLVGIASVVALSFTWNMSMGWVTALRGTSKILSTFAPTTVFGLLVADLFELVGIDVDRGHVVNLFRGGGLLLSGLAAWLLLRHSARIGLERSLGLTMLIVVSLGPVLWPWYAPMAFVVLAAGGMRAARPTLVVWSIALSLFVFPTSVGSPLGESRFHTLLGLSLLTGLTLLSLIAQWIADEPLLPRPVRELLRRGSSARPDASVDDDDRVALPV